MDSIYNFEEIDFQKYFQVIQRRWIPAIGIMGAIIGASTWYAFSMKPSYQAEGSLLIKRNQTSSLTGLGEAIGRLESLGVNNNPLDTQARIVKSVPVMQTVIKQLNLKDADGKPQKVKDFTGKIKVEPDKGTDVLKISYANQDPELAAQVVNQVMQVYIRNNIEANRAEAVSARKFILQQVPGRESSVREAESELRNFKEKYKLIALETEANLTVSTISDLEKQIAEAQAQLVNVTARSQKLQNEAKVNPQQAVDLASLSQNEGIKQVLAQLQEAQSKLAVERSRWQPTHPSIINLEEKVAALESVLDGRVKQVIRSNQQISVGNLQIGELRTEIVADFVRTEAERVGLAQQVNSLTEKWLSYKGRASVLPRLEQSQRQLERKLKAAQTTYETLLVKLQEIQVAENQNVGNARVMSPALVPDTPVTNKQKLVIGGGTSLGLVLGLIAAFSLDLIDRSVKTVKEAKDIFEYPLLGMIPTVEKSNKKSLTSEKFDESIPRIVGRNIPFFPIGNAYQMLQANLKFLSLDKELKSIVVTSSVSQEGKSEVATNLAVVMAQLGNSVLLVDANMRHPVHHHIWDMTNALGLSNVIVDQFAPDVAIQSVIPNLYVMPSGVIPPNPLALLDSQRMAALVASFKQDFDFVIFDAPPLAGTADAAVLSRLADGVLMVVRPGVVDTASANAAREFLKQSGQKVLGMVINGVNVNREPDSYFYYSRKSVETDLSPTSAIISEATSRPRPEADI